MANQIKLENNKKYSAIKNIFLNSSIIFTVLTITFTIIFCVINLQDNTDATIKAIQVICFYPFALALAFSNYILLQKAILKIARVLIHYFISILTFVLFIYLPIVDEIVGKNILVVTFIVTLAYAILMAIYQIVMSKTNPEKKQDKNYSSIYRKD